MRIPSRAESILVVLSFLGIIIISFQNCGGTSAATSTGSSSGTASSCNSGGTPVNIGSTTGGNFCQSIGTSGNNLCFDNQTLNFSGGGSAPGSSITNLVLVDVGPTCSLGITWPGGGVATIGQIQGDGYIGQFPDGSIIQFISGAYDGAKVALTYKYSAAVKANTLDVTGEGSDSCIGCGQGSGTIVSSPSGINMNVVGGSASGTQSATFPAGTVVTLTATPAAGGTGGCFPGHSNLFGAWIGSTISGGNTSASVVTVTTSSSGNTVYGLTANFGCQ